MRVQFNMCGDESTDWGQEFARSECLDSAEREGEKGERVSILELRRLGVYYQIQWQINIGKHECPETVGDKQEVGRLRTASRRQETELGSKASASWTGFQRLHFRISTAFPLGSLLLISLKDWGRSLELTTSNWDRGSNTRTRTHTRTPLRRK